MRFEPFRWLASLFKSSLHKNAIFLMANNVQSAAFGFVFWTIAARLYIEHDVGVASALISSMGLLAMASGLGFTVGLIRFLPQADDREYAKMVNSCFTISGALALVLAFVFVLGSGIWVPRLQFIQGDAVLVIAFMAFTLGVSLAQLLNGVFISARRAEFVFLRESVVYSISKVVLIVGLSTFAGGLMFLNIYFAVGIAVLVSVIVSLTLFMRRIKRGYRPRLSVDRRAIDHIVRFCAGNYVADFFGSAPVLILPLLITNVLGTETTAYFYLSWMMASLLFIIPGAVGVSLLSEMSHDEAEYKDKLKRSIEFIALLLTPAIIVFMLLGDTLLMIFGASYSANASAALRIFALSSIPVAVNAIYLTIKNARKEVRYVVLVNAIIAVVTLTSSYFTMKDFGLTGIALSWTFSHSLVAGGVLVHILVSRRRTRKDVGARTT